MKVCSVSGCDRSSQARGLCNTHYMQQRRAGHLPIGTRKPAPVEERFWRYVQKTDTCWIWIGGGRKKKGYGHISGNGRNGKTMLSHRLSYEIHCGAIPAGMVVMHTCDNPRCVNPAHLAVGSTSDNILDSFKKGRKVCKPPLNFGEKQRGAKLKEEDVRYIRANHDIPTKELSKRYGVTVTTLNKIKRGESWKHLL